MSRALLASQRILSWLDPGRVGGRVRTLYKLAADFQLLERLQTGHLGWALCVCTLAAERHSDASRRRCAQKDACRCLYGGQRKHLRAVRRSGALELVRCGAAMSPQQHG